MSACLERTRRWLRLAFACLAIVAGALPAQAEAAPRAQTTSGALQRPAAVRRDADVRRIAVQVPRRGDWPGVASLERSRAALCRRLPVREQGPPRLRFLVHRALLR